MRKSNDQFFFQSKQSNPLWMRRKHQLWCVAAMATVRFRLYRLQEWQVWLQRIKFRRKVVCPAMASFPSLPLLEGSWCSTQNVCCCLLLGQGQGPSSASWGGEWGLRRVRRDQQATCSKDCLWPYSVGMLRPSWGVPPAQVDFSVTVL